MRTALLIDVSGSLDGLEFASAKGLGQALHDNPMTSYCLVDKMYRSAVGRSTVDDEQRTRRRSQQDFRSEWLSRA